MTLNCSIMTSEEIRTELKWADDDSLTPLDPRLDHARYEHGLAHIWLYQHDRVLTAAGSMEAAKRR
jgi:hypothetical protein